MSIYGIFYALCVLILYFAVALLVGCGDDINQEQWIVDCEQNPPSSPKCADLSW